MAVKKTAAPTVDQEKKQVVMESSTTYPDGSVAESTEVLDEPVYTQPTCNAGMSIGVTRNVGNYESVKIQVSLHAPCYPQEVDEVFDGIEEKLDERLTSMLQKVDEAYGLGGSGSED